MAEINDPRPVLRQELARIFKNQRVIRAFEKIFDLIPPEFVDQQAQIDIVSTDAAVIEAQVSRVLDSVERLTAALEQLALAPPTPLAVQGADPTAKVGLTVVNGSAETYLRSDAAPPIDQAIAPTWTGNHTFTKAAATIPTVPILVSTSIPYIGWDATGDGANARYWVANVSSRHWRVQTFDDASGSNKIAIDITRGAGSTTITDVSLGNATDNPTFNFLGTSTPTHGSTTLLKTSVALTNGAAAAAGTLLNAPVAGNPTKWVPINDNGTTRYIPAW